eukprot:s2081_g4.t1
MLHAVNCRAVGSSRRRVSGFSWAARQSRLPGARGAHVSRMVCQKCEKKLAKLANPDVWREGGRNNTMRDKDKGARTINENMLLKHKSINKGNPYAAKCKHCKCALHQAGVPNPYAPRLLHPEPNGQVSPFPGQRSYPPAPLSSASPLHPSSALSLRQGAQLSVRPSTIPLPNSLRPQSMNRPPPPPMTMQAQSMPLPDEGDDGHVPIPHRIEDMGDGLARQPPSSQEKPPAWHDIEERPHLIEVELDELELHPDAPDLQAGWFESLKYFISLHPRSEEPDHIPLPRDPPLQSVDGHYLVSQAQKAYKPAAQVGFSEDGPNQNLVATFEEAMSLPMEKLDHHLVAYVWAIKSGMMGAQTTTLVGRALAPLQDFQLQRKTTTWGIFDILAGHRVAEMRLRYHVCTTPAAVEDIHSADVKQSEVTVRWAPPKNDHGAQVIGYQISILLDPKPNEPPQWYRLCECTKSKTPVQNPFKIVRGNVDDLGN